MKLLDIIGSPVVVALAGVLIFLICSSLEHQYDVKPIECIETEEIDCD